MHSDLPIPPSRSSRSYTESEIIHPPPSRSSRSYTESEIIHPSSSSRSYTTESEIIHPPPSRSSRSYTESEISENISDSDGDERLCMAIPVGGSVSRPRLSVRDARMLQQRASVKSVSSEQPRSSGRASITSKGSNYSERSNHSEQSEGEQRATGAKRGPRREGGVGRGGGAAGASLGGEGKNKRLSVRNSGGVSVTLSERTRGITGRESAKLLVG